MTNAKRHPALIKAAFCTVLAALCVLFSLNVSHGSTKIEKLSDDPYIIVSMGDSFASGEGVEPFYDQELPVHQKIKSADWITHRSKNSWSGKLRVPYLDRPLSAHKGSYWFFVANSGAKTADILGKEDKDVTWHVAWEESCLNKTYKIYNAGGYSTISDTVKLDYQLKILEDLPYGSVRYVTISIGGNDAQFATVLEKVIKGSNYLKINSVESFLDDFYKDDNKKVKEIMSRLVVTYEKIWEKAGPQATILVAGYPKLIDTRGYATLTIPNGSLAANISGAFSKRNGKNAEFGIIDVSEATKVNDAVVDFNQYIEDTVKELADKGMNIKFVDIMTPFDGHEAYSDDPYINPLYLHKVTYPDNPETDYRGPYGEDYDQTTPQSNYSFHPNIKGIEAYRQAFQDAIDQCEREIYHNISPRFYSDKTNPTPADPTPVDPTPADPTPVDPTPVDPTPVDPTPAEPTPVEPTPVVPEPITEQEVNEFLNGLLCETYHDEEIIFNHTKSDVMLDIPILENLYEVLRAENGSRYTREIRNYRFDDSDLSADDKNRLYNSSLYSQSISLDFYDLDGVKGVLNKLYGNGRVSLDQFFKGEYFLTSDGRLLLPVKPHGLWQMGLCRYKIRVMEQNGDEVKVTVSCIYVDSGYESDWDMAPRVFGPYSVRDLVSGGLLASGNDASLKEWSDYEAFADRFSVEGTNAGTVVITLFRDADGLHLK